MKIRAYFKESLIHYHPKAERILISDEEPTKYDHPVYIIIEDKDSNEELFNLQINSEYYCSLFRDIVVIGDLVLIGFDNHCYLFNIITKKIVKHKLKSYFDNFYVTENHFFICSASNINCFDNNGNFLWRSEKLGVASVKITGVENMVAKGSGDLGIDKSIWEDFEISIIDGKPFGHKSKKKKKPIGSVWQIGKPILKKNRKAPS